MSLACFSWGTSSLSASAASISSMLSNSKGRRAGCAHGAACNFDRRGTPARHLLAPCGISPTRSIIIIAVAVCALACNAVFGLLGTTLLPGGGGEILAEADLAVLALLAVRWLVAGSRLRSPPAPSAPVGVRSDRAQQAAFRASREAAAAARCAAARACESGSEAGGAAGRAGGAAGAGARLRRQAQTRRFQLRLALEQLQTVVRSLSGPAPAASQGQARDPGLGLGQLLGQAPRSGLFDYHVHAAPRQAFLLPPEVAACHYPADVSERMRRSLQDALAVSDSVGLRPWLPAIPE